MPKPSKTVKKKSKRLRWVMLFLLLLTGLLFFIPIEISRWNYLQPTLEVWKRLGITMKSLSISPRGKIVARGVNVGSPTACRIEELKLELSVAELFLGRITIHRAQGNSVHVYWNRLEPFLKKLQKKIPTALLVSRLSTLEFEGNKIQIDQLVSSHTIEFEKARCRFHWKPAFKMGVIANGIKLQGFPDISRAAFKFQGSPKDFQFSALTVESKLVLLEGALARNSAGIFTGELEFKEVDLAKISEGQLDSGALLEGKLYGRAFFQSNADGTEIKAWGEGIGENLHLQQLPFQYDPLIRDHMPELQDVTFDSLTIPRWKFENQQLSLDSIHAKGEPLSIKGNGRVLLSQPEVFFTATGQLTESYYRKLKPLVQAGLYRDSSGQPTFRFQVVGDFKHQSIRLEKSVSRVVKSLGRVIGEKFRSLVDF